MNQLDTERYVRQISLPEVGLKGQSKLASSSAIIVGAGGLGSPIATLLAGAGLGRIALVDFDVVSLSNLPRQTLYTTSDIGHPKVECAAKRLKDMNPDVVIETFQMRFDSECLQLVNDYDMIIDGCDNMPTRYVMDEISQQLGKPYIFGAINGFRGQVSVFNHLGAGSYSDLFDRNEAGAIQAPPPVMNTTPAIIGAIQANEAIKIAAGFGDTLAGRLLTFDSRNYSFNVFDL